MFLCILQGLKDPIRVVITGAAGQIAYSLVHQIASGDVFGKDQVNINLLFFDQNSKLILLFSHLLFIYLI